MRATLVWAIVVIAACRPAEPSAAPNGAPVAEPLDDSGCKLGDATTPPCSDASRARAGRRGRDGVSRITELEAILKMTPASAPDYTQIAAALAKEYLDAACDAHDTCTAEERARGRGSARSVITMRAAHERFKARCALLYRIEPQRHGEWDEICSR